MGSIGVTLIVDKIRVNKQRWFAGVTRREETEAVRVVMRMNGWSQMWMIWAAGAWVEDVKDRVDEWRPRTRVGDPKKLGVKRRRRRRWFGTRTRYVTPDHQSKRAINTRYIDFMIVILKRLCMLHRNYILLV